MLKSCRLSGRAVSTCRNATLIRAPNTPLASCFSGREPHARWGEHHQQRLFTSHTSRRQQTDAADVEASGAGSAILASIDTAKTTSTQTRRPPLLCPGCGALSQTLEPESAGYYTPKQVSKPSSRLAARQAEEEVYQRVLASGALKADVSSAPATSTALPEPETPICERCHNLLHQSRGNPIAHPSMTSIRQIIEASPHKRNHIYHIIDAADFPMSLIPNLQSALRLPRLRTRNRRSKTLRYIRGRVAEVSFIITRSDLLAPKKEQVDGLLPYLREVLRESLARGMGNVRLGNVRCVSAKRGWWTAGVKEEIWERGGAGWMVGKVNVGKSALFEGVFPKGRGKDVDVRRVREEVVMNSPSGGGDLEEHPAARLFDSPGDIDGTEQQRSSQTHLNESETLSFQETELDVPGHPAPEEADDDIFFDETEDASLLPPAQPETPYPRMPLVSSLPGTTASPIRIPFGNNKGELIDLPGIYRSSFETSILPQHRKNLIMESRVVPEQYVVKPGQSLLLGGGVVRLVPRTEDLVFMFYPFVPSGLKPHVTSHDKAVAIQTGVFPETGEAYSGNVPTLLTAEAQGNIRSAGTFSLEWDVTKKRAGPLTSKTAGKQKPANLPFVVYSADLLVESLGWIEIVAQVRNRRNSFITPPKTEDAFSDNFSDDFGDKLGEGNKVQVPEVEVWTPGGKGVDVRRPMGAWLLGGPKRVASSARRGRPRQTVSMVRRKEGGARGSAKETEL